MTEVTAWDLRPEPVVAVLMATYAGDQALALKQALDSIGAQTYPHNAIRIYLAIDGPIPEANQAVLDEFKRCTDIATHILPLAKNVGLAEALNHAASRFSEDVEFIFRFDSDDICFPERFTIQVQTMEANPDVAILGSAIVEFDNTGLTLGMRTYPRRSHINDYLCKASPVAHPSVVIRRRAWDHLKGYRPIALNEDLDMWFRAVQSNLIIDNLSTPLLYYRISAGFYNRRSWPKAFAEFRCYWFGIRALFGVNWRLAYPVMRLVIRLSPPKVTKAIYGKNSFRRKLLND